MTSFSFLPRPLRRRSVPKKREFERDATFPSGILLEAIFSAVAEKDIAEKTVRSVCEQQVPRSCHYVYIVPNGEQREKLVCIIRASSSASAKVLQRRLSACETDDTVRCERAEILKGSEEVHFWSRIPLRVKNRSRKVNDGVKKTRRRAGQKKKAKLA